MSLFTSRSLRNTYTSHRARTPPLPQLSVFRQQYQRHIKHTAHLHRAAAAKTAYLAAYAGGEQVWDIAQRANFSPYLMARLFVEWLRDVPRKDVGRLMRDPSLLGDDPRLEREVRFCVDMDQYSSPYVDRVRLSVGEEYEYLLQQTLRNRGIPFRTEQELRARGMSKTPDVRLAVPIGVMGPDGGPARVVNWIDSKAMFGDKRTHQQDIAAQLAGYVNRYGPGMVIYWFDFVETLVDADPDVLIARAFPDAVVLPDGVDVRVEPPWLALLEAGSEERVDEADKDKKKKGARGGEGAVGDGITKAK